ncbi:MAG: hypothetical protein J6S14_15465 [Clostridia bacterium]|nr:hypothetical protein [Clostridia bacterium]
MPATDEELKKYEEKRKKREILIAGGKNYVNRKIDQEFYDKVTAKIAEDNREVAGMVAVKLLYHPVTIACTIACLACVGGTLEGGTPFLVATLIGYVASYIGIAAVAFFTYAVSGQFKTAPPEQYLEIVWLMSLGCRLIPDDIDMRARTKRVESELFYTLKAEKESGRNLKREGYTTLELECLMRGFIPYTITDRCGMGFASAYKRHCDEIWRWQA